MPSIRHVKWETPCVMVSRFIMSGVACALHFAVVVRKVNTTTCVKRRLFHDLLRLPILHHYVWSEITGHNSLQRQR